MQWQSSSSSSSSCSSTSLSSRARTTTTRSEASSTTSTALYRPSAASADDLASWVEAQTTAKLPPYLTRSPRGACTCLQSRNRRPEDKRLTPQKYLVWAWLLYSPATAPCCHLEDIYASEERKPILGLVAIIACCFFFACLLRIPCPHHVLLLLLPQPDSLSSSLFGSVVERIQIGPLRCSLCRHSGVFFFLFRFALVRGVYTVYELLINLFATPCLLFQSQVKDNKDSHKKSNSYTKAWAYFS